jgi:chromosome segregation ATPase
MTNNDVVFDANSGISVEEQKEIMSRINGIAESNRRSLSEGSANVKLKIEAKKSGALFPVIVNIAALVILFGGGLILISFNSTKDAQVREGSRVDNLTWRALIEEIRGAEQGSAKSELELLTIEHRKALAIDAQLAGGLTVLNNLIRENKLEQASAANNDLITFLDADAFTSSRAFQAKRELYASAFHSVGALIEEVRRNRSGAVDAEMEQLKTEKVKLEEALAEKEKTIAAFSSDNTGQASRIIELEKSVATFNSDNTRQARRIAELERTVTASNSDNTRQANRITELERTVTALNSDSTRQTRRITELETSVSSLRSANSVLETSVSEKDRNIRALENEKAALAQTITARETTIRELRSGSLSLQQDIDRLNNQIADIRRALQELSQQ